MSPGKEMCMVTIADELYQAYMPFYIHSISNSYPEYAIRIYYHGSLRPETERSLAHLQSYADFSLQFLPNVAFPDKQLFKSLRWVWVDEELQGFKYIEVGDVDRFFVGSPPSLIDAYLAQCTHSGLPYSNRVRNGTRRMCGIHFVITQPYFSRMIPIMDKYRRRVLSGDIEIHNEELLYTMIEEAGLTLETHGLHRQWGIHLRIFLHEEPVSFYRKRYEYQFRTLEENAQAYLAATQNPHYQLLFEYQRTRRWETDVNRHCWYAGPGICRQLQLAESLARDISLDAGS